MAIEEEVKVNKADENALISTLILSIGEQSKRTNEAGAILIDWMVFRNTMIDWLGPMSQQIVWTLADQNGYMTSRDKLTLHQIMAAFFLHSNRDKKLELLNRAHLQLDCLERDVESLSVYGNASMTNLQVQADVLFQSKLLANSFSSIMGDIQS